MHGTFRNHFLSTDNDIDDRNDAILESARWGAGGRGKLVTCDDIARGKFYIKRQSIYLSQTISLANRCDNNSRNDLP